LQAARCMHESANINLKEEIRKINMNGSLLEDSV